MLNGQDLNLLLWGNNMNGDFGIDLSIGQGIGDPEWRKKVKVGQKGGREFVTYPSGETAYVGQGTPQWWSKLAREEKMQDIRQVMSQQRQMSPIADMLMKLSYSETLDYGKAADYITDILNRGYQSDWLMWPSEGTR